NRVVVVAPIDDGSEAFDAFLFALGADGDCHEGSIGRPRGRCQQSGRARLAARAHKPVIPRFGRRGFAGSGLPARPRPTSWRMACERLGTSFLRQYTSRALIVSSSKPMSTFVGNFRGRGMKIRICVIDCRQYIAYP